MSTMQGYYTRLNTLVIFRSLLSDPVISKLIKVFEHKEVECIPFYAEFLLSLYAKGDNLSQYLLNAVLSDENLYMTAVCSQKPVSSYFTQCLNEELALFEEISKISCEEIKHYIGYKGFLGGYSTSEYDFAKEYYSRLKDISQHGYGIFVENRAFLLEKGKLIAVVHPDPITIDRLPGYQRERNLVLENTIALLEGRPAANVLLYGDSGTGKSSTVKAVVNELYSKGLRLIELKKNQLTEIPALLDTLGTNPLHFILFIDDLSFAKDDDNFAALKAILEGSISAKTNNVVVYATSNRRHLVKESFSDRHGDDIHIADTIAELTSLSERFGLTITFERPNKELYTEIVLALAQMHNLPIDRDKLLIKAEAFALRRAGRSPRVAKQFIESLL